MTFLERKGETIRLPFVDDEDGISNIKALGLVVIPMIVMWITVITNFKYTPTLSASLSPTVGAIVGMVLWSIIPFAVITLGLYLVLGKRIREYFSGNIRGNWKLIIGVIVLSFVVSSIVRIIITSFGATTTIDAAVKGMTLISYLVGIFGDLFELFNEEMFGVSVFIGVAMLLKNIFKPARSATIYLAMIISALSFGLLHYDAYAGHVAQIIFVIGSLRLLLNSAFIRSRSILVSYISHYVYDELIFTITFLAGMLH